MDLRCAIVPSGLTLFFSKIEQLIIIIIPKKRGRKPKSETNIFDSWVRFSKRFLVRNHLNQIKTNFCSRLRVKNLGLDAAEKYANSNFCLLCNQLSAEPVHKHFSDGLCPALPQLSDLAESEWLKFQEKKEGVLTENENAILSEEKASVSKIKEGFFRCKICKIVFETSIGAMKRHAGAHRNGDFIRLYRLKGGIYRPEQHVWMKEQNRFFVETRAQKTTELVRITPPKDGFIIDKKKKVLLCSSCKNFEVPWDGCLAKDQQTYMRRRENKMLDHVRSCNGDCRPFKKRKIG